MTCADLQNRKWLYGQISLKHNTRTPGGHPEGYLEAFANIYRNFALTVDAKLNGTEPTAEMLDFPRC